MGLCMHSQLGHLALGQCGHQQVPQHVPHGHYRLARPRLGHARDHVQLGVVRLQGLPPLVHAIKAFKSRLQGDFPNKLRGVKTKVVAALEVIRFLYTVDPGEMGGFRVELTVGACTLADARDLVHTTRLLDPNFWLHPRTCMPRTGSRRL